MIGVEMSAFELAGFIDIRDFVLQSIQRFDIY